MKSARVAISKTAYWIDKPYEYLIPDELLCSVVPGIRVRVPFSNGNYICEAVVLSVGESSDRVKLKSIVSVLDSEVIISEADIRLALFMRERFFCTVYDALKAILPAGLWYNDLGKRRVKDAYKEFAVLNVDRDSAAYSASLIREKAPKQAEILDVLADFESLPVKDLLSYSQAGKASLNTCIKKGLVRISKKDIYRRPPETFSAAAEFPVLSDEQNDVYTRLKSQLNKGAGVSLLQGVTGSGKTSVFIHLIRHCLSLGKSVIYLVPEIALTPQMISQFSALFGDSVAVLHSSLTDAQRYDEWKRIKSGSAQIALGTRSAVFAPCSNLGLIIIDEEHESTYISENTPRYNAGDIAKYRCHVSDCMLLLGSATPDIVSRYSADTGIYSYYTLNSRFNKLALPSVSIVDMRDELRSGNISDFSSTLCSEIQNNLDSGEQTILFLNRRGTDKVISCIDCGYTFKCPKCSVSLTYHSKGNRFICHYCGYSKRFTDTCPECGGSLNRYGSGTQKIAEEFSGFFPDVPILRMDADSVAEAGGHDRLFERFRDEKIPVMIGTQMVCKGLNFENVTLVGVMSADQSLYSSDYRAYERTFSLITQVIGRSGRGAKHGRAVIQTFTPENQVIRLAAEQNYNAFYDSELQLRKIQHMPPFSRIYSVTVTGNIENDVFTEAEYISGWLRHSFGEHKGILVFGPAPLPVARVNNTYRYSVNISADSDFPFVRKTVSNIVIECNIDRRFKNTNVYASYGVSE